MAEENPLEPKPQESLPPTSETLPTKEAEDNPSSTLPVQPVVDASVESSPLPISNPNPTDPASTVVDAKAAESLAPVDRDAGAQSEKNDVPLEEEKKIDSQQVESKEAMPSSNPIDGEPATIDVAAPSVESNPNLNLNLNESVETKETESNPCPSENLLNPIQTENYQSVQDSQETHKPQENIEPLSVLNTTGLTKLSWFKRLIRWFFPGHSSKQKNDLPQSVQSPDLTLVAAPLSSTVADSLIEQTVAVSEVKVVKQILVIHGEDNRILESVMKVLKEIDCEIVLAHDSTNYAKPWNQMSMDFPNIVFVVVLLSLEAFYYKKDQKPAQARQVCLQNVAFDLGFVLGKFTRQKVFILYQEKKSFELPAMFTEGFFVVFDDHQGWAKELKLVLKERQIV